MAERQGGQTVEKGGRQRERERHTGEPSTQARSTWPTHIVPTRFLSLADNCAISLSTSSSSLLSLPSAHCAYVLFSTSFPSCVPSSLFLIFFSRLTRWYFRCSQASLFRFHVASCCCPCTLLPSRICDILWHPSSALLFLSIFFSRSTHSH